MHFLDYDLTEYNNFVFADKVDLQEYERVEKLEDLFNNFKPLIISEDKEMDILLIRRKILFGENDSYIYRLVHSDGSSTAPVHKFVSQYQCLVWNNHVLSMLDNKITKQSGINTFKFLTGLINYSQYLKRQDEIGDDSDISFHI